MALPILKWPDAISYEDVHPSVDLIDWWKEDKLEFITWCEAFQLVY